MIFYGGRLNQLHMGPNGPCSKLIYYDDTVYEGYITSRFTFVYKGVLIITQGCIWNNEQGL